MLERRLFSWLLASLAACGSHGQECCASENGVDVAIVLDRSSSITKSNWNERVIPWLRDLLQGQALVFDGSLRVSIIVFPNSPGKRDDYSGGADILFQHETVRGDALVWPNYVLTQCANAADCVACTISANDPSPDCLDEDPATTLFYPDGGWGMTPTWHALDKAHDVLYDGSKPDAKKLVFLVTDGAASQTRDKCPGLNYGNPACRHNRASFLTLTAAERLKNNGAIIYGLGIGNKFSGDSTVCIPFCSDDANDSGGKVGLGLFVGLDRTSVPYTYGGGTVEFDMVDDSPYYGISIDPRCENNCQGYLPGGTGKNTCSNGCGFENSFTIAGNNQMDSLVGETKVKFGNKDAYYSIVDNFDDLANNANILCDICIDVVTATEAPSSVPSEAPTGVPAASEAPSDTPSSALVYAPSGAPSEPPSDAPSSAPSYAPSGAPSETPSNAPSGAPSETPSNAPSGAPSSAPSFGRPSSPPRPPLPPPFPPPFPPGQSKLAAECDCAEYRGGSYDSEFVCARTMNVGFGAHRSQQQPHQLKVCFPHHWGQHGPSCASDMHYCRNINSGWRGR